MTLDFTLVVVLFNVVLWVCYANTLPLARVTITYQTYSVVHLATSHSLHGIVTPRPWVKGGSGTWIAHRSYTINIFGLIILNDQ